LASCAVVTSLVFSFLFATKQFKKMLPLREIPSSLELLIPPVQERDDGVSRYLFFEQNGASAVHFHPTANSLDWSNAWWLSECALLAYSAPADALPIYERAGFSATPFQSASNSNLQAYILHTDAAVVVVYRGTEFPSTKTEGSLKQALRDWADNVKITMQSVPNRPAAEQVHSGFGTGAIDLHHVMKAHLNRLHKQSPRPIWLTGHSLGGALATVGAVLVSPELAAHALYVFGCPRVGNKAFAANYPVPAFRFVNQRDLVPHLLPELFYRHVGKSVFFDSARTHSAAEPSLHLLSAFTGDGVLDHAPITYSSLAWNAA
jgi:hypothetical protein